MTLECFDYLFKNDYIKKKNVIKYRHYYKIQCKKCEKYYDEKRCISCENEKKQCNNCFFENIKCYQYCLLRYSHKHSPRIFTEYSGRWTKKCETYVFLKKDVRIEFEGREYTKSIPKGEINPRAILGKKKE
jgi:hypothetical protein